MTTKAQTLQRRFPIRVACTLLAVLTGSLLVFAWLGYAGALGASQDATAIAIVFAGSLVGRCVLELHGDGGSGS